MSRRRLSLTFCAFSGMGSAVRRALAPCRLLTTISIQPESRTPPHAICRSRPVPQVARGGRNGRLFRAHRHPGGSHSRRADDEGHHRHRADWNRQDREFRVADDRHPRPRPPPRLDAAQSHPRTDAGARRSGRGKFREVRQEPRSQNGAVDRRRANGGSGKGVERGRRRAHRYAWPADGSVRAGQDPAERLRPACNRRGGPDAGHGFHPGHRVHLFQTPRYPTDDAVFRRPCRRRSRSWRKNFSRRPSG